MTRSPHATDLRELWEETFRLETELDELRTRLETEFGVSQKAAEEPIEAPWDVAPYCWAIRYGRVLRAHTLRVKQELSTQWTKRRLAKHNRREQLIWRDTSHDETSLRLI